ncbi:DUF2336 domain-containing protein [Coralliovum pocilloporae]|uniref:DUF2336 domain-containing protein n=1 Tax=Coralliovum pocilloporae TaxID=3066369 RepID=UPI003307A83A
MRNNRSSTLAADLAHASKEKRPGAVLRSLVDLYQSSEQHNAVQMRMFTELGCSLYDRAEIRDRAFAARNLASRPDAPRDLMVLMALDDIMVARPVLKRAKTLTAQDYLNVIQRCSSEHRALVAERPDLGDAAARAIILSEDRHAVRRLASNAAITLPLDVMTFMISHAGRDAELATSLTLREDMSHKQLAPLFLMLDAPGKLAVIRALANEPVSPSSLVGRAVPGAYTEDLLEEAADLISSDDLDGLGQLFAERAKLPIDLGRALARDPGREGLLLILHKHRIPIETVHTFLLTALPADTQSLDTLRHLSEVYSSLTDAATEALFKALQQDTTKPKRPRHVPVLQGNLRDALKGKIRLSKPATQEKIDGAEKRGT